jgi:hypothetical protein
MGLLVYLSTGERLPGRGGYFFFNVLVFEACKSTLEIDGWFVVKQQ